MVGYPPLGIVIGANTLAPVAGANLRFALTGNAGLLDFMANSAQNISGPAAVHLVLLGAFLYALVFFAVLYIPTRLLLKRRLNLP